MDFVVIFVGIICGYFMGVRNTIKKINNELRDNQNLVKHETNIQNTQKFKQKIQQSRKQFKMLKQFEGQDHLKPIETNK